MINNSKALYSVFFAALTIAGCTSGGSSGEQDNPRQPVAVLVTEIEKESASLSVEQAQLAWSSCVGYENTECATLLVPMDYTNPGAGSIEVEMARLKREDRSNVRRTILMNPGGPGGSGVHILEAFSSTNGRVVMSDAVIDQFELVSFDPRGVGLSTPVECDLTPLFQQNVYPTTAEDFSNNAALSTEFADACSALHGEYLQHISSHNVVQDMNEMRKALGLAQIDFLGYSYGTRLAALFMQNFPEKTGRFILDGSMPPSSSVEILVQGGLTPAQSNLDVLANACIGITILCNPDEFSDAIQQRVDVLATEEMTNESALLFSILQFASTRPGFEQLLIGRLSAYVSNDFDVTQLERIDQFLGLSESAEDMDSLYPTANIAVLCADDAHRPTADELLLLSERFNEDSDLLAEAYTRNVGQCIGWPQAINPVDDIATNQAPISLVIGGPTDAQTPLIFSEQMASALGGQFLESRHVGHTTVFSGENLCTERVVNNFLLTGEIPTESVCDAIGTITFNDWRPSVHRR